MTFNTLCDFCARENIDNFSKRKAYISSNIKKYSADLISLQEIRSGSQVEEIFKDESQYSLIYPKSLLVNYSDTALAINRKKFNIIDSGVKWLGPNNGGFSFGWRNALPRTMVWAKVQNKKTLHEFLFIGSHFDNIKENTLGSANFINSFITNKGIPTIFAGDTNSTPNSKAYDKLVGDNLIDSFNNKGSQKVIGLHKDLCYIAKGKEFPDCRVDHIFFSKDSIFKVNNWHIDTARFGSLKRFPSDHRPVIVNFTLAD